MGAWIELTSEELIKFIRCELSCEGFEQSQVTVILLILAHLAIGDGLSC